MKRKYLKYFIGVFVFAVVASVVVDRIQKSNTPAFLLEKFEELKSDQSLMNSIGGYHRFEYSDQIFYKSNYDSLIYEIIIFGNEKKTCLLCCWYKKA
ncbi:hypothetical protein [Roseivirga sp. UBA838]|uniref:hypothetical protein n=1 Tax=Roseivirga sp. UBA838 TaxID=1947393 RepID=UPI00257C975D|nr:hypothetical protein [Roseivirga sp. UBA838]|tara:strand:- start:83 stop:373 length:291 start_codon:yes stop_codon:yes gene_type:complete